MLKKTGMAPATPPRRQRGSAAVEFALIAIVFFTLLLGIIEFGRLLYLLNTVQEVTRKAAREAVVRWRDQDSQNTVKSLALFGGSRLPAGAEITAANIKIEYLMANETQSSSLPVSAADNVSACLSGNLSELGDCIALVRVSIIGSCPSPNTGKACYTPMIGLFSFWKVPIPASTVVMPAESMGFRE